MRLVLAEMMHETNTFSPIPTPLEAFQMGTGRAGPVFGADEALARFAGTNTALGGLIEVASGAGAEIAIPIGGGAPPSGRVDDDAFESFAGAITGAVAQGCDAVLLALHGAMATVSPRTAACSAGAGCRGRSTRSIPAWRGPAEWQGAPAAITVGGPGSAHGRSCARPAARSPES